MPIAQMRLIIGSGRKGERRRVGKGGLRRSAAATAAALRGRVWTARAP